MIPRSRPLGSIRRLSPLPAIAGILACLLAAPARSEEEPVLRAGAATSNITPPLGEPIVGGWSPFPATHIHDELHARCLALDDGETRIAIVACDNVGIPREVFDAARDAIGDETDLPPENVLLSATHTHSATSARGESPVGGDPLSEYSRFLARRVADVVRIALNNLEPAEIGWGSARAPEHVFNRRWFMEEGPELENPFGGVDRVRMNPPRNHPGLIRPAGPTDPEVAFVAVRSREGKPIALLANYSLHYVGGVPRGHVSADYFGIFADRIRELLGSERQDPPFVAMMTNGTSGDINNIDFQGDGERLPPYEKMRVVARDVARKVFDASKEITYRSRVPLGARMEELSLEVRKPSPELLARAREILARPDDVAPRHRREEIYARRTIALGEAPERVSVPLQALRIGDLGIAAIPFEVFAEIGLEIKERSPFEKSFTISLANGSYGYLPTPEQHELGGYETWLGTNRVELEASRKITATLLGLLEELAGKQARSPEEVFRTRILPIFDSPDPSSCVECHLSAVDLKDYICPSQERTFVSLRDRGLIDLDEPRHSKILRLIRMRPEEKERVNRIHERNRRAEYEAFAAWIEAACRDEKLREAPSLAEEETTGPERPREVIRHNRIDRVVDSFARNVWSLRFRCAGCHMPGGAKFEKHHEEHGDKMGWLRPAGPEATLRRIVANGLLDLEHPEKSKLLLKPLNVLEHGGGIKMAVGDTDYVAFLQWIRDYAAVVRDGYASAQSLPHHTKRAGSEVWLRIEGIPARWLERRGILTVHERGESPGGWREEPVALGAFNVRKNRRFGVFAQSFLMIESATPDGPRLPPGVYLVRVHLREEGDETEDFDEALSGARLVDEVMVRSRWRPGFRRATVGRVAIADERAEDPRSEPHAPRESSEDG